MKSHVQTKEEAVKHIIAIHREEVPIKIFPTRLTSILVTQRLRLNKEQSRRNLKQDCYKATEHACGK